MAQRENRVQAQCADQPQDNRLADLMSLMQFVESKIGSIDKDYITEKYQQHVDNVDELEADVMGEGHQIQERIQALMAKVESHINTPDNLNGCLRGVVDDYLLDTFNAQLTRLREKFEADRAFWNRQVQNAALFEQKQAANMKELFAKFKHGIAGQVSWYQPGALKDIDNFGTKLQPAEVSFRWPTEADLKQLNLVGPLKLKEIRTTGAPKSVLTQIQFIFENGIESPLIQAKRPSEPIETFQVPDKPVQSIGALVHVANPKGFIKKLELNRGGVPLVFYDKPWVHASVQETRQIPANHSIVGFYGRFVDNDDWIANLGFIVMED